MSYKQHPISERAAVAGLVIAALFWGLSYPLTKYAENCPTFYMISLRFGAAALFLAAAFHRRFKALNKTVIKYAFLLSFAVFLMFAFGKVVFFHLSFFSHRSDTELGFI